MPASIQVTRSFKLPLDEVEFVTREDMRELALLLREQIVRETIQGIDAEGRTFSPYSPGYAKAKRAALGTSAVNLQVSGAMLNDITVLEVQGWNDPGGPSATLGWNK